MHHTLVLFSTIPDLNNLEIHYIDPYSRADFKIDRKAFDAYTPTDIERSTSSSRRFNRVVIDGYVLDESRRQTFSNVSPLDFRFKIISCIKQEKAFFTISTQ